MIHMVCRIVQVGPFKRKYKDEWEVLFNYGTKFRVLSYEYMEEKDKHFIVMEESESSLKLTL